MTKHHHHHHRCQHHCHSRHHYYYHLKRDLAKEVSILQDSENQGKAKFTMVI